MYYILFNPKAGAGTGESKARKLDELLKGEELNYISVFDIKDYRSFLAELKEDDKIVIVGGDGSLNYFVNDTSSQAEPETISSTTSERIRSTAPMRSPSTSRTFLR